jgi:hypothetical protein
MLSRAVDLNQNMALSAEKLSGGWGRFLLNQITISRKRSHSSLSKIPESNNKDAAAKTPSGLCESLCTRVVTKRMNMVRRSRHHPWHVNALALTRFRVNVEAAFDSLKAPAVSRNQAAHFRPGNRLHTAMSKIWMFDSGCLPCSRITSSTPAIASRMLAFTSSKVSPCE